MNPLDLRGPAFLGFYLFASVVGLILLYLVARAVMAGPQREAAPYARRLLKDPYLVSYLRGGAREVLHTLVFALHERKLLTSAGEFVLAVGGREALQAVSHPLEKSLLSHCSSNRTMRDLISDAQLKSTIDQYAEPLREAGLVADEGEYARRRPAFRWIAGGLTVLAVVKMGVALHRGHANILFLVILMVLTLASAYAIHRSPRTNAGRRALHDQQTLFARLRNRVTRLSADGATNEALLVAATFGLAALPATAYPYAAVLDRRSKKGSSSCSSGCGSGGSSCGGGGCGGGCGGCGG